MSSFVSPLPRSHRGTEAVISVFEVLSKAVRLGAGVATVRQYLQAGLIDELHLAISPKFLGEGENLFAVLDLPKLCYQRTEHVPSASATHVVFTKCAW